MSLCDGDTFEHRGYTFRVNFPVDQDHEPPWDDGDGNGIVSEWTSRDKRPGERLLYTDKRSKRFYDYAGTMEIAKRDGWDAAPFGVGTKGEQAARAVDADFERMRRWCNDDWRYVGVVVTLVDDTEDAEFTLGESESLWGIEDDDTAYLASVARELADEILSRIEVETPDIQLSEN